MYQIDRFLELAHSKLNEQVSTASVEEIRSIQESDRELRRNRADAHRNRKLHSQHRTQSDFYRYFSHLREQLELTESHIASIQDELDQVSRERVRLEDALANSEASPEMRHVDENISYREHKLWQRLNELQSERDHLHDEITKLSGILDAPSDQAKHDNQRARLKAKRWRSTP